MFRRSLVGGDHSHSGTTLVDLRQPRLSLGRRIRRDYQHGPDPRGCTRSPMIWPPPIGSLGPPRLPIKNRHHPARGPSRSGPLRFGKGCLDVGQRHRGKSRSERNGGRALKTTGTSLWVAYKHRPMGCQGTGVTTETSPVRCPPSGRGRHMTPMRKHGGLKVGEPAPGPGQARLNLRQARLNPTYA